MYQDSQMVVRPQNIPLGRRSPLDDCRSRAAFAWHRAACCNLTTQHAKRLVVEYAPRLCGDDPKWMTAIMKFGKVFPACVGMTRTAATQTSSGPSVPRLCGDSPNGTASLTCCSSVFPAYVLGMTRSTLRRLRRLSCVPRLCRDDPNPLYMLNFAFP